MKKTTTDRQLGIIETRIAGRNFYLDNSPEEGLLTILPQKQSLHDRNAIKLLARGLQVGHVPATIAAWLRPLLDLDLVRANAWHSGFDQIALTLYGNASWDLFIQTVSTFDPVIGECAKVHSLLEKLTDKFEKMNARVLSQYRTCAHELLDLGGPGTLQKGTRQSPTACAHHLYHALAASASKSASDHTHDQKKPLEHYGVNCTKP